jgi:hypothetical protein
MVTFTDSPTPQAGHRIHAIRDMGSAGYVLGADALIDLLRAPDVVPKQEILWALEAISGLTLGDDPDRWSSWWSEPPLSARQSDVAAIDAR